jgi:hypothetical protein
MSEAVVLRSESLPSTLKLQITAETKDQTPVTLKEFKLDFGVPYKLDKQFNLIIDTESSERVTPKVIVELTREQKIISFIAVGLVITVSIIGFFV